MGPYIPDNRQDVPNIGLVREEIRLRHLLVPVTARSPDKFNSESEYW
jgi:hypothetical protein